MLWRVRFGELSFRAAARKPVSSQLVLLGVAAASGDWGVYAALTWPKGDILLRSFQRFLGVNGAGAFETLEFVALRTGRGWLR